MSRLEDFKSIADEMLSDIKVDQALKAKTIMRLQEKQKRVYLFAPIVFMPSQLKKAIVTFGSLALILGLINFTNITSIITQPQIDTDVENNLLLAPVEDNHTLPGSSNSGGKADIQMVEVWELTSIDEDKVGFGDSLLTPNYVPKGFKLEKIKGYGPQKESIHKVVFTYLAIGMPEKSFLIIEDKNAFPFPLDHLEKVELDGIAVYLKKSSSANQKQSELDTELHWQIDGTHYQIIGLINEHEAIKIAKSMHFNKQ